MKSLMMTTWRGLGCRILYLESYFLLWLLKSLSKCYYYLYQLFVAICFKKNIFMLKFFSKNIRILKYRHIFIIKMWQSILFQIPETKTKLLLFSNIWPLSTHHKNWCIFNHINYISFLFILLPFRKILDVWLNFYFLFYIC